MKVNFVYNIRSYSGKLGSMVYYNYFNYRLCYLRKFTAPTLGENHEAMKEINLNLNALYLTANAEYRDDLKVYCGRNAMENHRRSHALKHRMPTSKALFTQLMWKWAKENPESIDLKTVTFADMLALDSPVCRVCTCVNAGYIKKVTGWESLDRIISE